MLVRCWPAPPRTAPTFTLDVFTVAPGTDVSTLFLGIVFGLLSFAGFEAAATLGEEAHEPAPRHPAGDPRHGDLRRRLLHRRHRHRDDGVRPDDEGVKNFIASPALMGDLGTSYIGSWVGDLVTLGAAVSAFGCCLACVVGASRLLFAISRDLAPGSPLARTGANATPAAAAGVIAAVVALIALVCALASQ